MTTMTNAQVQDVLVRLAEQHLREQRATDAAKPTAKQLLDFLETAGYMPASEFASFHRALVAPRIAALLETWVE